MLLFTVYLFSTETPPKGNPAKSRVCTFALCSQLGHFRLHIYWNYAWCEISRLDNMTISSHGGRSKCADACWCKPLCWEIASCQPLNLNIHACHTSSIQPQGIGPWKYAEHWSNPSRTFRLELEAVLQLGTTIIDLVIAWQWRRIKIWGATNARQNLAISLTLGILHSGRICFSIFFHLAKRILGRHCLQN